MKTPVEIARLRSVPMEEIVTLSAVSGYLKKEIVRASTSGFVSELSKSLGQKVLAGEQLMIMKTREASALKSMPKDSTLRFNGLIHIIANSNGVISQIDHQTGDYVGEGDPLLTLVQPASLVFFLKVPYSEHTAIKIGESLTLLLPDGRIIKGKLLQFLTSVDTESQTQDCIIEPETNEQIPDKLWIQVPIKKRQHKGNYSLPKACIQGNETQTEFWVMRLHNDSLAIKVPITKGIESDSLIEILSPVFGSSDRFVCKGSYGLPDTAHIQIKK